MTIFDYLTLFLFAGYVGSVFFLVAWLILAIRPREGMTYIQRLGYEIKGFKESMTPTPGWWRLELPNRHECLKNWWKAIRILGTAVGLTLLYGSFLAIIATVAMGFWKFAVWAWT